MREHWFSKFAKGPWPESFVPTEWPQHWRRAFLVTLPISGPIWCAMMLAAMVGYMLMMCIVLPIFFLCELKEAMWDKP